MWRRPGGFRPRPCRRGTPTQAICFSVMALPLVSFLALVFTAVALVPYGAHLFSLPNKIGMTEAQYFIAQSIYQGRALLSLILIPAMLFNVVLAYLLRGNGTAFYLAAAACVVMAAT